MPEKNKITLKCVQCGKVYPWSFSVQCPDCNNALIDIDYDLSQAKIGRDGSMMERYFDFLPLTRRDFVIDGGEGNTPCVHAKELGKALGFSKLYAKMETANPTRTTKDRQGTMAVAALRDLGISRFITSSTGNSCTSLARIVSRFPDMHMSIFVGDEFLKRVNWVDAPNVDVYWLKNGTFVEAHQAARWWSGKTGDSSERGFFFFGKREALKIAYMEAVEQVPEPIDYYVQGISSAMGVYSTWKASYQMKEIGLVDRIPGLICVQEETCNPMVKAWQRGEENFCSEDVIRYPRGLSKCTLRGDPSMVFTYVRHAVADSGGTMLTASQDDMREMKKLAMDTEGMDICHTAAMTLAGIRTLLNQGWLKRDAVLLLNMTGADRVGAAHAMPNFVVERDEVDEWRVTPFEGGSVEGALDRVERILVESQKLPGDTELDTETWLLGKGLALDSVALLEFSLALEKEFEFEVTEEELNYDNFRTIGSVADLFRSKMANRALNRNA